MCVFLISFFRFTEIYTKTSITILISVSIIFSFILGEISDIEEIWKLLFLKKLANIECYNRIFTKNPSFFNLPKEAKNEIHKLDKHISKYFKNYVELLIILIISSSIILLIVFKKLDIIDFKLFDFYFNNLQLTISILLLSILFFYNSRKQITKDFSLYKNIYENYVGSNTL